jgi:hypothetical protein
LVILGDSRIIIQALILHTKVTNEKLQHILDKIQLLLGKLYNYQLYHVLWGNNASADAEANKGTLLRKGLMLLNGATTNWDIP